MAKTTTEKLLQKVADELKALRESQQRMATDGDKEINALKERVEALEKGIAFVIS